MCFAAIMHISDLIIIIFSLFRYSVQVADSAVPSLALVAVNRVDLAAVNKVVLAAANKAVSAANNKVDLAKAAATVIHQDVQAAHRAHSRSNTLRTVVINTKLKWDHSIAHTQTHKHTLYISLHLWRGPCIHRQKKKQEIISQHRQKKYCGCVRWRWKALRN